MWCSVAKQAMFSTVKSRESVVEMLVSKSEQISPRYQQSISSDELMKRYQSLHDRAKVMLKM